MEEQTNFKEQYFHLLLVTKEVRKESLLSHHKVLVNVYNNFIKQQADKVIGESNKIHNEELRKLCCSHTVTVIKSRR